jgi:hypothetical protein
MFWIVSFACLMNSGCPIPHNVDNNIFASEAACRNFVRQVEEVNITSMRLSCQQTDVISISPNGSVYGNSQLVLPWRPSR